MKTYKITSEEKITIKRTYYIRALSADEAKTRWDKLDDDDADCTSGEDDGKEILISCVED